MDINAITQAVTSLGFPIAAYMGLFWYIIKRDSQHQEEMSKITEAVNNNTLALTKLMERMEHNEQNLDT